MVEDGGMAESAFEKLVEHARSEHVVVVGAGIAGLVAALECAKVGLQVTLNGTQVVDVRDTQFSDGPIALQYGAGVVKFRNVRIRTL